MFKLHSAVFLFVTVVALSLAASAALEAGMIKYQASADPTTVDGDLGQTGVQPWVPDGAGTTGTASTGGGGPIWLVENAAGNRWSLAPDSADNIFAWRGGWTLDMSYVIPVGSATCSIWSNRFCLEFGNDTHGIRLYQAVYDTTMPGYDAKFHLDIGNGTGFVFAPGIVNVIDVNGYHSGQLHTLKLVYTPGTGTGTGLDMFMDDELRINDLQLPAATADCTLRWGRDGGTGSIPGCYVGYQSVSLSYHSATIMGDANFDGVVDAEDAEAISQNWLTESGALWSMGDFSGDGAVNDIDAAIMAANWGRGSAMNAAVPEPSVVVSMVVLCAAGLFIAARRRLPSPKQERFSAFGPWNTSSSSSCAALRQERISQEVFWLL